MLFSSIRQKSARSKVAILFTVSVMFLVSHGCTKPQNIYTPQEWLEIFKKTGGWVPLPIPDSKYQPGAILKINDQGIFWIDNLETCGCPLSDFIEVGIIPGIVFEKAWQFQGNAILNLKGISAGPEFGQLSKIRMEISKHGSDALRLIKLRTYIENNTAKVATCMEELLKADRYLVTEAFRVSKGKYTLLNKSGAAIKLTAPILAGILQIQPDLKYEISAGGELIIEQPVYFAIRKAQNLGQGFEILGSPAAPASAADDRIETLFKREYDIK